MRLISKKIEKKHTAVATLWAIVLFLASSCITVDKTLGTNNIPEDSELKMMTDRIRLPLTTKLTDSLQALSTSVISVGAIRTEQFGLARFVSATNYAPISTGLNFGASDRIIKRAYIYFVKSSSSITQEGEDITPQTFHLYRMKRAIDTTSLYNTMLSPEDYYPTPIDSNSTLYLGGDTLTLFLKHDFAKSILNASKNALDTTSVFVKEHKGILLTCDDPIEGVNGGRLNVFNLSSSYIYITFNFQPTWSSGLARKDTSVLISLGNTYAQNFSSYDSKDLQSDTPQQYINIEGVGGLKPYLDPGTLKDTLDGWARRKGYNPKDVMAIKATFVLPYEQPAVVEDITNYWSAYLYPSYREKDSTYIYYYPLAEIYSTSNNLGINNRSLQRYHGDFTGKIQKAFSKDRSELVNDIESKVWFTPLTATQSSSYYSSSTTYTTNTDKYTVTRINGPLHQDYPYIELVYTVVDNR